MYQLKPLPYAYNALEPVISKRTLELHHDHHAQRYVDNLNATLAKINYDGRYTLPGLIFHISEFPLQERDQILYNAGGVLNHELYFDSMGSNVNHIPVGKIKEAINQTFGNYDNFKKKFIEQANYVIGSGYTFLTVTPEHKLEILNTSNQETPYLYGLTPIMALDLWEHAYYLDYQYKRADYINQFFSIVDFDRINENYEKTF